MASAITMEKVARPELAKHESSILDLVFVMDCTGSMGSYIASATNNIRSIVEEIVVSEKSDIRLALVEYRDHPPQDHTFVTRVHDFTAKVSEMKGWLQECQAIGGGDAPEAVADGLHAVLKLSWRAESTKICILIADAPPHGLNPSGDGFPNGCPNGLDPVQIVREMAEKHITLYSVGVEPPIMPYRDFFMSLAYTTGGQYVPMVNAKLLAKVIIGGVREEISLDRLIKTTEEDINREMERADAEGADDKEKVKRISNIFTTKNLFSTHMTNTFGVTSCTAKAYSSTCQNMAEMQHAFLSAPKAAPTTFGATQPASFTFGPPPIAPAPFSFGTSSTAALAPTHIPFPFGTSSAAPPTTTPTPFTFGTSSAAPTATTSTSFTFGTSSAAASGPAPFALPTSTELFGADGAPPTARAEADMTYDVTENAVVNEDQAERIYQKWQHRKK
ncbi:unnamed protein product [Rotaria sp. Silwood1]|nr:unnamed protein product [Rotaria sp. Silwood1]CAF4826998.1 unnamed protein product [Rotaria sp. Silwood1]